MKIDLVCVGKLGASAEAGMARDYAERASRTGRPLGLGPVAIVEVEPRKSGKAAEAEALLPHLSAAHVIACDERGRALTSRALSERIARLRDDGVRRLVFVIGGADGLDPNLVAKADETLAFGVQTWPHALVRVMLAEQVYRAATLLAGSPYHRD